MKKRTKILVPIDFSPCSDNALKYALCLADRIDAIVEILNVTTYDAIPLDFPAFVATVTEEKISMSRTIMRETIEKIKKEVSPLLNFTPSIETDIEVGVPETKIIDVANRDKVDYIIMGTQGQNTVMDRFLGSTAVEVVKYTPCPIFVIPEKAKLNEDIMLGYATDFKASDPFEIWKITKLLQPFQADIAAIHLSETGEFVQDKIEEFESFFRENVPYADISFYSLHSKDMVTDINTFIKDHNINLMAMYKPKKNFFERLFHRSFTKNMVRHTEVPLLILNEK